MGTGNKRVGKAEEGERESERNRERERKRGGT
jgi:hypothetical protein